jgi:hypothetical protein
MKKHNLLLSLLILQISLFAQQERHRVSGRVVDKLTGEALLMAPVQLKGLGIFTVTDLDGRFTFDALPAGTQTFVVQYLGYQTLEDTVSVTRAIDNLVLSMNSQSLSLEVVEVVAQQGSDINSSSVINRQALEHVQPQSLQDVMRLVPGFVGGGGSMMGEQLMTIRSVSQSGEGAHANAFGTAIIVDGASINNDASMQGGTRIDARGDVVSTIGAQTTFDARQVSAENIESVEIIRGVPSVEFANMTSGAVVIRTRAGLSPYEVRFRTDPQSKLLSASKGFRVGQTRGGILNIGADYTNTIQSLVQRTGAFDRFNLNTAFRTNLMRDLTMNVRLIGNYSVRSVQTDPDLREINNWIEDKNKSLRLTVEGVWTPKNRLNILLDYTFSGSVAEQNYHSHLLRTNTDRTPFATSREGGIFEASWIDQRGYYEQIIRNGLPMDLQAKLIARSFLRFDNDITNRAILGFEWNTSGNRGEGTKIYPFQTSRVRNFNEIPFMHRFSFFAENRVSLPIGPTRLDLQAGARANFIVPNEAFEDYQLHSIGPSFNARYQVLDKSTGFRQLAVRAGWGMSYRMPTLASLFPEPIYTDRVLFSYSDWMTDTLNPHKLALLETRRLLTTVGTNLKMPQTVNMEFGLDFAIRKITGSIAFFNEKSSRSYENLNVFTPYYGERWFRQDGTTPTDYGLGEFFRFYEGRIENRFMLGSLELWQPLPTFTDSIYYQNPIVTNGVMINKWGFEMTLNLGRIQPLSTSVQIDLFYVNEARTSSNEIGLTHTGLTTTNSIVTPPSHNPHTYTIQHFVGSRSRTEIANVRVNDRLSSNIRLVTHIPRVGIVTTLTCQVIVFEGDRSRSDVNGKNMIFFFDTDGIYGEPGARITGDLVYKDEHYVKHLNPVRFMDIHGNFHDWEDWMEDHPNFRHMRISTTSTTSLRPTRNSPYMMLDLRVSKDIGKNMTMSLFAENFLHLLGLSKNNITGWRTVNNPLPRFGAEIRMRF